MPAELPALARKGKDRSSIACDFCRGRKLGCDNARPRCENCELRDQDCTYAKRVKQARPSKARIRHLEEENARLRESLRRQDSPPGVQSIPNSPPQDDAPEAPASPLEQFNAPLDSNGDTRLSPLPPSYRPLPLPSTPSRRQRYSVVAPDGHFHGPSSALFEEESPNYLAGNSTSQYADNLAKDQLLAATTRQRQLELINLKHGKLDFDGTDPELGMQLLSIFWNRQHYSGSFVYRPTFMRDMACNGPYFSKFLLNAVLFSASKYLPNGECPSDSSSGEATGQSFRRKFEQFLHSSGSQILFKSHVTTIQALLVISDTLLSWCDEMSLTWHYLGIAINMIVDLGIHIKGTNPRSTEPRCREDLEVHRRVFWSAFILDKVQSIYQGRPARLREADNRVPIKFLDEYEELEPFHTLTYSPNPRQLDRPTYGVSTFEQLCKLGIIMDRILCNLYAERSLSKNPADMLQVSSVLYDELKRWRDALPAHLSVQLDNPASSTVLPHSLSLLSMYNSLVILLHRPFVSDGHLQLVSTSAASDAFSLCTAAALEIHGILQLYQKSFCMMTAPYFVSYATYVSATIHVRIAAQRNSESEAHKCLRNCLDVLGQHQVKCYAPRRTTKILQGLIHRLNVNLRDTSRIDHSHQPGVEIMEIGSGVNGVLPTNSQDGLPSYENYQPDLDPILTNIDIDEIMRSFGYEMRGSEQLSNVEERSKPSTATAATEPNPQTGYLDMVLDSLLFIDPLFGIDGSHS
ncbi:hypothetical protein AK830_g7207 [Neonectria ditissima]|uniref:Zn(2)-C6 fungal-type domain-containing protein n=1 Tax=Neonectria ditissima TaxID=78410 RepID=A0A0P7BEJ7_9HYPO|nr:hypothetical protein AK830_g7207 [Neonectria ditissima]